MATQQVFVGLWQAFNRNEWSSNLGSKTINPGDSLEIQVLQVYQNDYPVYPKLARVDNTKNKESLNITLNNVPMRILPYSEFYQNISDWGALITIENDNATAVTIKLNFTATSSPNDEISDVPNTNGARYQG